MSVSFQDLCPLLRVVVTMEGLGAQHPASFYGCRDVIRLYLRGAHDEGRVPALTLAHDGVEHALVNLHPLITALDHADQRVQDVCRSVHHCDFHRVEVHLCELLLVGGRRGKQHRVRRPLRELLQRERPVCCGLQAIAGLHLLRMVCRRRQVRGPHVRNRDVAFVDDADPVLAVRSHKEVDGRHRTPILGQKMGVLRRELVTPAPPSQLVQVLLQLRSLDLRCLDAHAWEARAVVQQHTLDPVDDVLDILLVILGCRPKVFAAVERRDRTHNDGHIPLACGNQSPIAPLLRLAVHDAHGWLVHL
mmetsp:Transcript_2345/g.5251  ORF Transcript_2345/g.5251 Transcript_2345/m.5251 type:complete len:304 (-) Transcript_2345:573-1484(-)